MSNGVVFYEHINFEGKSWTFDGDQPFVGWDANDQFSSMKVPAGMSVQLFAHRDFAGKTVTVTSDVADMRTIGWNDFASSVKFAGGGGGVGSVKALRLKKGGLFVECNAGGTVALTSTKTDNGKVTVTRHDDKRYDATFVAAKKILTIDPGGDLMVRAEGSYGLWQQLSATTQPEPDIVNVLYRVHEGVVIGGVVLQIVEE